MKVNFPEVEYVRHATPMLSHQGAAALYADAHLSVRDDLGPGLQDVPGGEREEVVRPTQDLRCLEKLVRVEWRTVKTD